MDCSVVQESYNVARLPNTSVQLGCFVLSDFCTVENRCPDPKIPSFPSVPVSSVQKDKMMVIRSIQILSKNYSHKHLIIYLFIEIRPHNIALATLELNYVDSLFWMHLPLPPEC